MKHDPSVCRKPRKHATLEHLPSEIRQSILRAIGAEDLHALTRASPTFFQQYASDRPAIVWHLLRNELGSSIVDAVSVLHTTGAAFLETRNFDVVHAQMQDYRARKLSAQVPARHPGLTAQQAIRMLSFYMKVVRPIVSAIVHWSVANFSPGNLGMCISDTERARLVRALYRYQLCCNLFGAGLLSSKDSSAEPEEDLCTYLLLIFEPWEIEEILCVFEFVKTFHHSMFDRINRDIGSGTSEPQPQDTRRTLISSTSTPDHASVSDEEEPLEVSIRGISSLGLHVLISVYHIASTSDPTALAKAMHDHTPLLPHAFLDDDLSLSDNRQERLHSTGALATHRRQDRHELLPFVGDDLRGPPLAWTLLWHGVYSARMGGYMPPELRRWGYVFWDKERVQRDEVTEELRAAWEERWDGVELRDEVLGAGL